jgi:hypothetical protein
LNTIGNHIKDDIDGREQSKAAIYHGKEEWLLKWLLKKLQAAEDVEPRYASLTYVEVLSHINKLETIPHRGDYYTTSCRSFPSQPQLGL